MVVVRFLSVTRHGHKPEGRKKRNMQYIVYFFLKIIINNNIVVYST